MATVFWDPKGGRPLCSLREAIKQKRQDKLGAGILLLNDNAPIYMARVSYLRGKRFVDGEELKAAIFQARSKVFFLRGTDKLTNVFKLWG